MIKISRMADYGVVALSFMARDTDAFYSAAVVSERTGVPLPSASKLLKLLVNNGVLVSRRGAAGGYGLARSPQAISVADLVIAVDGPIALAEYAACQSDARMTRFSKSPSMRNMATFGMLDELRHGQIQLYFPHQLAKCAISASRWQRWRRKTKRQRAWRRV